MNYINRKWLDYIWGSIGGDVDYPDLVLKDMKNIENFDILMSKYIKPSFDSFPSEVSQVIKNTWKFAINNYDDETLEKSFESGIPPFELPNNLREFYIKVWESLFFKESWYLESNESFTEIDDPRINPWDWVEKRQTR